MAFNGDSSQNVENATGCPKQAIAPPWPAIADDMAGKQLNLLGKNKSRWIASRKTGDNLKINPPARGFLPQNFPQEGRAVVAVSPVDPFEGSRPGGEQAAF